MLKEAALVGKTIFIKHLEPSLQRDIDPSVLHHVEPIVQLLRTVIGICSYIGLVCHTAPYRLGVTVLVLAIKLCIPLATPYLGSWLIRILDLRWEGNLGGFDPFRRQCEQIRLQAEREKDDVRLYGLDKWLLEKWSEARRQLQRSSILERGSIFKHEQLQFLFYVGLDVSAPYD